MKKLVKKITTIACLIIISLFSVGCSGTCAYNCYNKAGDCAEKTWDCVGCYFYFFKDWKCIPSCVFQSDCYQEMCIDCFYGIGDSCKSDCQTKGVQELKEGTVILNKEDYSLFTDYNMESVDGDYYKITVTYTFTAMKEMEDVIVGSTVSDGANSTRFYIYMGNRVKKGETISKLKTVVFKRTQNSSGIKITATARGKA